MLQYIELKIPPLIVTVLTAALIAIVDNVLPNKLLSTNMALVASILTASAGLYFCCFGIISFRRAETTVDPRYPDKTRYLVETGVYSISRNPMYLGFVLLLTAEIIYLRSPLLVLFVVGFIIFITRFQIKPEELLLQQRFGRPYHDYCSRVRRWV